jgi:hypothetical protein
VVQLFPRFWAPWSSAVRFDPHGYLPDPDGLLGSLNADVVSTENLRNCPCLLLLGTPGMGKTTALKQAHAHAQRSNTSALFDLGLYGSEDRLIREIFDGPALSSWKRGEYELELFLDSLDECRIRLETSSELIVEHLRQLPIKRLKLRLACRSSDLPPSLLESLDQLWRCGSEEPSGLKCMELMPLRRRDVQVAAETLGAEAAAFVETIERKNLVPLANRPLTLEFLIATYESRGQLPEERAGLYHAGCIRLCQETNPRRNRSTGARSKHSAEQRMAVAGRIAAVTMACGRSSICLDAFDVDAGADSVSGYVLAGYSERVRGIEFPVTEECIAETLQTALFVSTGPNQVSWSHWAYAEYLAAQYLRDHNVDGIRARQLLMHHKHSERVIPQLRETAAWLACLCRDFRDVLMRDDPLVLLRSDATTLQERDREQIVGSILDPPASG